jgi:hypothetical protein
MLQRNPSGWTAIGGCEGVGGRITPEREETLMRLWTREHTLSVDDLRLPDDEKDGSVTRMRLKRMADDGLILRVSEGSYDLFPVTGVTGVTLTPIPDLRHARHSSHSGHSSHLRHTYVEEEEEGYWREESYQLALEKDQPTAEDMEVEG